MFAQVGAGESTYLKMDVCANMMLLKLVNAWEYRKIRE